jgi:hypothetical protein
VTTKEKVEQIFRSIDRAEISMVDVQRLTSISRETLYKWKNGGTVRDFLRLDRVMVKFAILLERAVSEGKLPLQNPMKTDERIKLLRKIIANAATKRVE